jgi:hypothetical protein
MKESTSVGIDVAARSLSVRVDGSEKTLTFENTPNGRRSLVSPLTKPLTPYDPVAVGGVGPDGERVLGIVDPTVDQWQWQWCQRARKEVARGQT